MLLKNKVAIVTGASSGIGRAIAQRLSDEGAKVVVADIDENGAKDTLSKVSSGIFVQTDVCSEAEVKKCVNQAIEKFGNIDVLVNCVGIYSSNEADITSISEEYFDTVMDTNFKSVVWMSKYCIPELMKTKGNIVNIASICGLASSPESTIYGSAKAAVIMFTKNTAVTYSGAGVRINCISPGAIDTPLLRNSFPQKYLDQVLIPETFMKRVGTPEEVANVALFLASCQASYVTGVVLPVDGGESLKST
jgi:NAD(P)-dependent dehydrogenase (short-subunit alcohol dehydrogenase family)